MVGSTTLIGIRGLYTQYSLFILSKNLYLAEENAVSMEEARLQVHKASDDFQEKNDFTPYLKNKSWCDALDSLGVWRLGRIRRVASNGTIGLYYNIFFI